MNFNNLFYYIILASSNEELSKDIDSNENFIRLYEDKNFKEYTKKCQGIYKNNDKLGKLQKLIAFIRHGDRAPLNASNLWNDKKCVLCMDNKCKISKCSEGQLTKKGYDQSKNVGSFIEKNYLKDFNKPVEILGISTGFIRTTSTLKGILNGLGRSTAEIKVDVDLNNSEGCKQLQYSILQNFFPLSMPSQEMKLSHDQITTSICGKAPLSCGKEKCDSLKIRDIYDRMNLDYESRIKGILKNRQVNAIEFSFLAKRILEYINLNQEVVVVAGHDTILNKILTGLNVKSHFSIPSYASGIFIEIWETEDKEEVVRVIYDGDVVAIGLYEEKLVKKEEFHKYLNLFASQFEKLKPVCRELLEDKISMKAAISKSLKVFKKMSLALKDVENTKQYHKYIGFDFNRYFKNMQKVYLSKGKEDNITIVRSDSNPDDIDETEKMKSKKEKENKEKDKKDKDKKEGKENKEKENKESKEKKEKENKDDKDDKEKKNKEKVNKEDKEDKEDESIEKKSKKKNCSHIDDKHIRISKNDFKILQKAKGKGRKALESDKDSDDCECKKSSCSVCKEECDEDYEKELSKCQKRKFLEEDCDCKEKNTEKNCLNNILDSQRTEYILVPNVTKTTEKCPSDDFKTLPAQPSPCENDKIKHVTDSILSLFDTISNKKQTPSPIHCNEKRFKQPCYKQPPPPPPYGNFNCDKF